MKSNLKFTLFTLVFGLFICSTAFAQNFPDAYLSADVESILLSDGPLVEKYEINFSNWTEEVAQNLSNQLGEKSKLISLEVDYPKSKLILTLELNAPTATSWGFEEWKAHLLDMQ